MGVLDNAAYVDAENIYYEVCDGRVTEIYGNATFIKSLKARDGNVCIVKGTRAHEIRIDLETFTCSVLLNKKQPEGSEFTLCVKGLCAEELEEEDEEEMEEGQGSTDSDKH